MKTLDLAPVSVTAPSGPRLADLGADCLLLALHLRTADDFGTPDVLRARIYDILNAFERAARRADFSPKQVEEAKFALVAFIDEAILASNWDAKDVWLAQPLQLELYDRYDAGEEFFTRLEAMQAEPEKHAELLEIYYLILTLGFKGRYHLSEAARLRYLIEELYYELQRMGKAPAGLSPHGQRPEPDAAVRQQGLPLWMLLAAGAGIFALLYIVLSLVMTGSAQNVVEVIEQVP